MRLKKGAYGSMKGMRHKRGDGRIKRKEGRKEARKGGREGGRRNRVKEIKREGGRGGERKDRYSRHLME